MGSIDETKIKPETEPKQSLYAEHVKIYPKSAHGTFRKLKWSILGVLLGIYYLGPFIRWDRGPTAPDQAILLDMAGRRGYFFWIEIWPQEIYYLTGILILGAVGLFLATALAGRVWCGFTCPQTVWTDLFLKVEEWFEGDRNKRMMRDRGPWTVEKFVRKFFKHIVWLIVSVLTGGVWVLYFTDATTAVPRILTGEASGGLYSMLALFTATTYVLAGWAREQVCIYMCPWPRFQGAMFDEDSLIVTYEEWRGEPRGKAKRDADFSERGHCVDCTMCVQVCPTGVDIREGQQMACIGCGLCIDACNTIMEKYGLPGDLITYDSINNQVARAGKRPTKLRLVRPRTIVYGLTFAIISGIMIWSLSTRDRLEVNIQRDRAPMFVRMSDGSFRNGYTFKLLNMESGDKRYVLTLGGLSGATMRVIGVTAEEVSEVDLKVGADKVGTFKIYVRANPEVLKAASNPLDFIVRDKDTGEMITQPQVFHGPRRNALQ